MPVLVDVELSDGCISADTVASRRAVGQDFAAILPVHFGSSMVDIPAIKEQFPGVPVVEDCAQAHGAAWQGRTAGTLGDLGCFSMQNQKVLSCGEGGAVATDDPTLFQRLQELRADARSYGPSQPDPAELELIESASVMGHNYCLSELQSALLVAQLEELDVLNARRHEGISVFREELTAYSTARVFKPKVEQTAESVYEVSIILDELSINPESLVQRLSTRTGVKFHPIQAPLHRNRLLEPASRSGISDLARSFVEINGEHHYPNAEHLARKGIQFHHSVLLGGPPAMRWLARQVAQAVDDD